MAKAKPTAIAPVHRGRVRELLRQRYEPAAIRDMLKDEFPALNTTTVRGLVTQEEARQTAVQKIYDRDKRTRYDLFRVLKCPPGTQTIRAHVRLVWIDPATGNRHDVGFNGEMNGRGRLADNLNRLLQAAIAHARGLGSNPPEITSADTAGNAYYVLNYVECG